MAHRGVRASMDRQLLRDVIPLNTPLKVSLFCGDICNLKCRYCLHSVENSLLGLTRNLISRETFSLILKELEAFPEKVKTFLIAGLGEPLLHPDIVWMLEEIKRNNICEKAILVTNGLLMDAELANKILGTGIDQIEISIQGVDEEAYKRNCGKKIDFISFYDNLKYLYNNKGKTNIYIQSLDSNFLNEKEQNKFWEMFDSVSDVINIAPTLRLDEEVDYAFLEGEKFEDRWIHVCPQIFYQMHFLSDGTVIPCCHALRGKKLALGNIYNEHLVDIWFGNARKHLLLKHLRDGRESIQECKTCMSPNMCVGETDALDDCRESILKRLGE